MTRCTWGNRLVSPLLLLLSMLLAASAEASIGTAELLQAASARKLDRNPTWQSLLHATGDQSAIQDTAFILSAPDFSARDELAASIALLFDPASPSDARCRFPARFLWLSAQLELPEPDFENCAQLQEFIRRAPVEKVSLVYASENLTQPSSMMGHIFLKISGTSAEGYPLNHAISFFTEIDSINVPKVIAESLLVGKPGYYTLSPYYEKLNYYLKGEQRNVWEYDIQLTGFERTLIQYHMWELRSVKLTYFFHSYNCATLTNNILSLAEPSLRETTSGWATPIDVVKSAHSAGRVASVSVYPSEKWKVKMLYEQLTTESKAELVDTIQQDLPAELSPLLQEKDPELSIELALSYADWMRDSGQWPEERFMAVASEIERIRTSLNKDYVLDISSYKKPTRLPHDSQVYGGIVNIEGDNHMRLGAMPASHYLADDNSQYLTENELRLADLSILVSAETGTVQLDELQLYSAISLAPHDPLSGGLSGRFSFGFEPHFNDQLESHTSANIGGDLGQSFRLHRDVLLYWLAGGGAGAGDDTSYLYGQYELGTVVNEIFNMKTIVSGAQIFNQLASDKTQSEIKLTQAKPLGEHYTLVFDYARRWNREHRYSRYDLQLKYLY